MMESEIQGELSMRTDKIMGYGEGEISEWA